MSKPPATPYPPDLAEDATPATELGAGPWSELVDIVVEKADGANEPAVRSKLLRTELRGCRLTGADLGESSLIDVTFADCKLDLLGFRFASLRRVAFVDCVMPEADFYAARLEDVLFEGCELREATFSEARLERVELRGCDLAGLRGIEALRGIRMPWVDVIQNAGLFAGALAIEILD